MATVRASRLDEEAGAGTGGGAGSRLQTAATANAEPQQVEQVGDGGNPVRVGEVHDQQGDVGDCRERRAGHQQHAHPPAGGATGDDADRQHQHRQIARGVERAERTIHLRQRIVGRHLFDHRQPQHGVQPEEQQHAIDHGGESARQPLRVAQISQPQQQRGVAECVEHGDGEWRYARDAGLATEDEQEPGRRPEGDRTTDESPRGLAAGAASRPAGSPARRRTRPPRTQWRRWPRSRTSR